MYFSKREDDSRQNNDSLNFPFSNKKSNKQKKFNDDNSLLNVDDDKVVEQFDEEDD